MDMFKQNKPDFLHWYMTIDETWIHHFTPESSQQSAEWWGANETHLKLPKMRQSAGKLWLPYFGMLCIYKYKYTHIQILLFKPKFCLCYY